MGLHKAMRRLRVLVADDHPAVAAAITRLLSLDCDVVGCVADGALLLEEAQRLRPDVLVLDVHLPNVDGLEACREITKASPEIKVIVFTALVDIATKDKALAAGASAFVSKLAGAADLLSALERLAAGQS
jgi:DNA-binding NarL/FixJ family response regulator